MSSGTNVLMVPLPISHDVDIRQKSKMAVAEMYIILRMYGWCKTISNTQWANLSVHKLNENKSDNMWNMSTPDNQDGVAIAPETGSSYNLD